MKVTFVQQIDISLWFGPSENLGNNIKAEQFKSLTFKDFKLDIYKTYQDMTQDHRVIMITQEWHLILQF